LEPESRESHPRGRSLPETPPIVRTSLLFYIPMLGLAWIWSYLSGIPLLYATLEASVAGIRVGADFALGLAAAAGVIILSDQLTRRTRIGAELAAALAAVLGRRTPLECVALALVSGIAEEAFFRGAMQPDLGLVATSILFGAVHFVPRREFLPWTLFAIAAGFLLGGLFDATGNLVAPIVAHVGINAVNLWLLTRRYGTRGVNPG
jgi:membrane protease YdiL (CAAX protease family)